MPRFWWRGTTNYENNQNRQNAQKPIFELNGEMPELAEGARLEIV
jgi:hypothetical protein